MANTLNEDITGRVVLLKEESVGLMYKAIAERLLLPTGGFGCFAETNGTVVSGWWLAGSMKGAPAACRGYDVERYATEEEIARWCPDYLDELPERLNAEAQP